jgi:hypothetical protein
VVGLLVGGVLGRIAMLVLRVTTGDSITGVTSDDGFEIGRFTLLGTLNLMFAYSLAGIALGLVYAVARRFLPRRGRVLAFTALSAAVGGSIFVHADGVDYLLLDPPLAGGRVLRRAAGARRAGRRGRRRAPGGVGSAPPLADGRGRDRHRRAVRGAGGGRRRAARPRPRTGAPPARGRPRRARRGAARRGRRGGGGGADLVAESRVILSR